MKIKLIDVDSKIPNLALMKLSAYHKQKGDQVGFNISDPDQVYVSCIFKKNREQALGIEKMFSCPVTFGGSGINYHLLPDEIEHIKPDYRFAWDNLQDEKHILNGIEMLKDHGINHSLFYVLVGFNTSSDDDLYRLNKLKELDQRAYVMRFRTNRFYNDLSAWANQQRFFMSMDFDRFVECRHKRGLLNAV